MNRFPRLVLTCGFVTLAALAMQAAGDNGPPPAGGGDNPGAQHSDGPPPGGFHMIPRFVMEKLNLNADQQQKIADLEKETKAKLDKILTADQKKILEETRPPRKGDGPPPPPAAAQ